MNKENIFHPMIDHGKAKFDLCSTQTRHQLMYKLVNSAQAFVDEKPNQFKADIATVCDNVKNIDSVTGKPWLWDNKLEELQYLTPEHEQMWKDEINEQFLITLAIVAKRAGVEVQYDVGQMLTNRINAKLELCAPCNPNAPLGRRVEFVEKFIELVEVTSKYDELILPYLSRWYGEANRLGYVIPEKILVDFVLMSGDTEQAEMLLIRDEIDERDRQVRKPINTAQGARLMRMVSPELIKEYVGLIPDSGKLSALFLSELLYEYESTENKMLEDAAQKLVLDICYKRLKPDSIDENKIYLRVAELWPVIQKLAGKQTDRVRLVILDYFKDIAKTYGFDHVEKRAQKQIVNDKLRSSGYEHDFINVSCDHVHTPSEQEALDRKRSYEDIMIRSQEIQDTIKKDNSKWWNLDILDTLVRGDNQKSAFDIGAVIKVASVLRGIKGLDVNQIIMTLENTSESNVDFVGIGALLGIDTTKSGARSEENKIRVQMTIGLIRTLEPYLNFEK